MSTDTSEGTGQGVRRATRKTDIVKLLGIAAAAFAFTFSLVPIYRIACQKVFGIRMDNTAVAEPVVSATPDMDRVVTVEFDGAVNSKLPWSFRPNETRMQVQVGKVYETTFFAQNNSNAPIVGSATPSVAPARASIYFQKTECFCFTAQTLEAGEVRDMPVRFIIDPSLPEMVDTVTLSYMFFKNEYATERLAKDAGGNAAQPLAAR